MRWIPQWLEDHVDGREDFVASQLLVADKSMGGIGVRQALAFLGLLGSACPSPLPRMNLRIESIHPVSTRESRRSTRSGRTARGTDGPTRNEILPIVEDNELTREG
jgi:hypothetical protein